MDAENRKRVEEWKGKKREEDEKKQNTIQKQANGVGIVSVLSKFEAQ